MQKVKNGISAFILFLTAFCFGYLTIFSPSKINDRAEFLMNNASQKDTCLFVIAGAIFITIFIVLIFRLLDKLKRKGLIIASVTMFAIMTLIGVYLLNKFLVVPSTDSYAVFDQALKISKGEATTIDGYLSYFDDYSNNNLFVLFMSGFFSILSSLKITEPMDIYFWSIVLNGVFVLIGCLLTFDIVRRLKGLKPACKTLVFFVINPLFYMMMFWVYTCTISIPFMVLGFYLAVLLCTSKSQIVAGLCGGGIGALAVVGYFLRPTCIIPLIALAIGCIFYVKKDNVKRLATCGLCAIVLFSVSFFVVNNNINSMIVSTSKNFPLTHWIMMGLHGDGTVNEVDNNFTRSFQSKEQSSVAIGEEINKTLNSMSAGDMWNLGVEKSLITWGDGSGGYNMRTMQDTKFTPLYTYLVAGKIDAFLLYAQMFRIATLGLCFICVLIKMIKRRADWTFVFSLTVLGGILFYIIWEAKNAYSVPFLPFMFVLAMDGAEKISSFNKRFKSVSVVSVLCLLLMGVTTSFALNLKPALTKDIMPHYEYSVYSHTNQFNLKDLYLRKTATTLTQEFYAKNPFNKIEIKAKRKRKDPESKYLVTLQEGNTALKSYVITSNDINTRDCLVLEFDAIKPKKETKYLINISPLPLELGKVYDSIAFVHRFSQTMDQYKGELRRGGRVQQTDLHIRVYKEYLAPYVSENTYRICFVEMIVVELALMVSLIFINIKKRRKTSDLDSNSQSGS